jgi:hypothetical protein
LTDVEEPIARTASEGGFRLGGVVFRWSAVVADGMEAWVSVAPEALAVLAADSASTPGAEWSDGFLELARQRSDDAEVRVLSQWWVYQPEFDWPIEAAGCGCLDRHGFGDVALSLNGGALVASPGPVFDRFLLKADLLGALFGAAGSGGSEVVDVTFSRWAAVVGLDHAFYAPGYPDYSAPTTFIRQALSSNQAGEAHEAYLRAFDSYYYGGLPTHLAEENKRAYLGDVEARHGFDYVERDTPGVRRRILTVNSLRMRTSLCCTSIEERGAKVFASTLERIAETTSFA